MRIPTCFSLILAHSILVDIATNAQTLGRVIGTSRIKCQALQQQQSKHRLAQQFPDITRQQSIRRKSSNPPTSQQLRKPDDLQHTQRKGTIDLQITSHGERNTSTMGGRVATTIHSNCSNMDRPQVPHARGQQHESAAPTTWLLKIFETQAKHQPNCITNQTQANKVDV